MMRMYARCRANVQKHRTIACKFLSECRNQPDERPDVRSESRVIREGSKLSDFGHTRPPANEGKGRDCYK